MPNVTANHHIVCWQSTGQKPVGVDEGFFQQTHVLLGARPSREGVAVNAFNASGTAAMTAPYSASLSSMNNLYLRTTMTTGNFQSTGHERFLPNSNQAISSQIFARIPIHDPTLDTPIIFQDNGSDMFRIQPGMKSLESLEMFLTDEYGNTIPEISPNQVADGLLSFTVTLRFDVLTPAKSPVPSFIPTKKNINAGPDHVPSV